MVDHDYASRENIDNILEEVLGGIGNILTDDFLSSNGMSVN